MKLKICFHGILGGRKGKDGKGGMWNPKELYDHFNERVIIPNQDSFDIEISIHSWNENEKMFHFGQFAYGFWIDEVRK